MENTSSVAELVDRLRKGERIKCLKCGKGYYVTDPKFISTSNNFWCDKCKDLLHTISDITVE